MEWLEALKDNNYYQLVIHVLAGYGLGYQAGAVCDWWKNR